MQFLSAETLKENIAELIFHFETQQRKKRDALLERVPLKRRGPGLKCLPCSGETRDSEVGEPEDEQTSGGDELLDAR